MENYFPHLDVQSLDPELVEGERSSDQLSYGGGVKVVFESFENHI
jgi:hypothetical protein